MGGEIFAVAVVSQHILFYHSSLISHKNCIGWKIQLHKALILPDMLLLVMVIFIALTT